MKTVPCSFELLLIICFAILPMRIWGQSKVVSPPKTSATQAKTELDDQEIRGEGLFIQRCGLCHLPKRGDGKGPVSAEPVGGILSGVLKGVNSNKVDHVRQVILQGTPIRGDARFHSLGFRYSLGPKQVDDLIAYLKTL